MLRLEPSSVDIPPPIAYLDNSALGRLTDADPRLATEAALVAAIIAACLSGRLRLLISEILALEVRRARSAAVRATSNAVLDAAWAGVRLEPTRDAAGRLEAIGFRPADALHLAAAYTGGAAYAVSCDAHWLRRADRVARLLGPGPAIVTPAECVRREGL